MAYGVALTGLPRVSWRPGRGLKTERAMRPPMIENLVGC